MSKVKEKSLGGAAKKPRGRRKATPAAGPGPEDTKADLNASDDLERAESAEASEPGEPSEIDEGELLEVDESPVVEMTALAKAVPGALSTTDPLRRYMQEVTRHHLLTREEEHALAVRLRETGDVDAAYRLVASNLRLVVKLAHEYHRNPISLLDLIQEGNIGLMQAVKKYDPYRGVKLSSYAAWWIRAYILRYIMDNWKMVKLGTTEAQRKLFFKLRQEQERLLSQGFDATPKLLAERLSVSEQDVVEMDQRLSHDELSLDLPVGDEGKGTRGDRLAQRDAVAADEALASAQLKAIFKEKLAAFAATLEGKERTIFEERLMADEPLTLQQIGDKYGLSRERARQLEAALIVRMREYVRSQIPDFDLVAAPKD